MFADVDTAQIIFGDINFTDPAATINVPGVVRLATDGQAIAGMDKERALSPSNLLAALDQRLGERGPTEYIKDLLSRSTAAAARSALGIRTAALSDAGHGNGLDADMLDGRQGDWYRDFRNMLNVPQSFLLPGQIVVMASLYPPNGLLVCDGAEISRAKYAALFAAIGTVYGAGDGSTTFNVPKIKEGTVITHTSAATAVVRTTPGRSFPIRTAPAQQRWATTPTTLLSMRPATTHMARMPGRPVTMCTMRGPMRKGITRTGAARAPLVITNILA